jgi:hypothetical protein
MLIKVCFIEELSICVGPKIAVLQNLIQGELVNGSVGQVVAFSTAHAAQQNHTDIAQVADANITGIIRNRAALTDRIWPVVRFTNGRIMLILPVEFTVNNAQGEREASREQVCFIYVFHPPLSRLR